MGVRGCFACLKYLVFIINFLVLMLSLVILVFSTWLLVDDQILNRVGQYGYLSHYLPHYLLLSIGLLTLLLSFLGCCGAIRESACLLGLFFTSLLLLFLAQLVGGIFLYFREDVYRQTVSYGMVQTVLHKYHPNNTISAASWDYLQTQLECCGAEDPMDWSKSIYNGYQNTREIGIGGNTGKPFLLPSSCCTVTNSTACSVKLESISSLEANQDIFYTTGCVDKLLLFFQENLLPILIVGLVTIVIEIFGMIFSLCLCTAVKRIEDSKP